MRMDPDIASVKTPPDTTGAEEVAAAAQAEIDKLTRRLNRERRARIEAERIAEQVTGDLYKVQHDLKLLQTIASAANQATDLNDVLYFALCEVCTHTHWPVGHVYLVNKTMIQPTKLWYLDNPVNFSELVRVTDGAVFRSGIGLPGRVAATAAPEWIEDVYAHPDFPRARISPQLGIRSAFAFPVCAGPGEVVAILEFFTPSHRELDQSLLALMNQVGTQLGRVAERRHAEDALRLHELRFRHLFENVPVGIYRMTPDKQFVMANPALVQMLGCASLEELQKWGLRDPDARGTQPSSFRVQIDRYGEVIGMESRCLRRDGKIITVRRSGRAVYNDAGELQYYEGTVEDVTDRRLADKKIEHHLEQLASLRRIDTAITSSLDLRVTLDVVLEQVTTQLHSDAAAVLLLNARAGTLEYSAWRGFKAPRPKGVARPISESRAGRAVLEGRMVQTSGPFQTLADGDSGTSEFPDFEPFSSSYAVPLVAKGTVRGVLEVFFRSPFEADAEWTDFLETLAGQASIAVDNASLWSDVQRSNLELTVAYDATIEGWSRALDLRDHETEGHTRRVTEMTMRLAKSMGIPEEYHVHLRRGSLLHDIGKMGVPDHILLKPGPLTDHEWSLMRKHPDYAYEFLAPIRYLNEALDIPYCHHEKWDGSGYPRGLKAEKIPLAARIFCVVDVWDALRSNRPYRSGWPEEKVIEHIRSLAGIHFDPQVVDAFLKLLSETGA